MSRSIIQRDFFLSTGRESNPLDREPASPRRYPLPAGGNNPGGSGGASGGGGAEGVPGPSRSFAGSVAGGGGGENDIDGDAARVRDFTVGGVGGVGSRIGGAKRSQREVRDAGERIKVSRVGGSWCAAGAVLRHGPSPMPLLGAVGFARSDV
jgi:hypothetical protein